MSTLCCSGDPRVRTEGNQEEPSGTSGNGTLVRPTDKRRPCTAAALALAAQYGLTLDEAAERLKRQPRVRDVGLAARTALGPGGECVARRRLENVGRRRLRRNRSPPRISQIGATRSLFVTTAVQPLPPQSRGTAQSSHALGR